MSAKILLLDIETAPNLGWTWGKYEQNVIEFEHDWYILCYGYKWFGDTGITVRALPDYSGYSEQPSDDRSLISDLHVLLDEADFIVAHNGDSFDIKKINSRFLIHGMKPPSTYKTIDTLKIVRKHFKFDSNKLNDLGKVLGIGTKVPHVGFALWKGCMSGDPEAWELMRQYNAQDVALLDEIYLLLRPWFNHPDVSMYGDDVGTGVVDHSCPSCGGHHINRRGTATARSRKYQRLNCQDCGRWFQGDLIK